MIDKFDTEAPSTPVLMESWMEWVYSKGHSDCYVEKKRVTKKKIKPEKDRENQ